MEQNNEYNVSAKIVHANPSALGIFGLAVITFVAATQKLGWTDGTSLLIPWAIFLGAGCQLYASIVDSKLNNLFGATVFGAYAFFWLSVGSVWLISNGVFGEAMQAAMDGTQLAFPYFGYFLFSVAATIAAGGINKILFIIMVCIDVLLISLTFLSLDMGVGLFHPLAGWSEMATAISGFYGAIASLLNGHFGKVLIPVGQPFISFKK
ncbi:MAG: acetate uptake transporter [Peptostreptococcales bacterium]